MTNIPSNPKVLTKDEIKKLLRVPTTKREARRMKQRFIEILKMLDTHDYYPENADVLACPHCMTAYNQPDNTDHFNCTECTYREAFTKDELDQYGFSFLCVKFFTFGNISHHEIKYSLILDRHEAILTLPVSKEDEERIRTFCLGHIQWANIILKRKSPNGKH